MLCYNTINCEIHLKSLEKNSVFLETIGECYFYKDQVTIGNIIDVKEIFEQPLVIETSIKALSENCKACDYKNEIRSLNDSLIKIKKLAKQLKLILYTRPRRGLLNIMGSISKGLFGTLDENDLSLINQNMDKLFDSNNKMKIVIGSYKTSTR